MTAGSEGDKILSLVSTVRELDPDFIFTDGGDSFILPYLAKRAQACGIGEEFSLDRETVSCSASLETGHVLLQLREDPVQALDRQAQGKGAHRHSELVRLRRYGPGRLLRAEQDMQDAPAHLQQGHHREGALFACSSTTRTSRTCSSPGNPRWRRPRRTGSSSSSPTGAGSPSSRGWASTRTSQNMTYSSLYPNIMLKKNISGETVRCSCCPESTNRVPELDWNVCQRRTGIVPKSMEIIVGKRLRYKKLKNDATKTPEERARYDARQVALKWIGVTSFGYLGHANAKFGRIDAHIAVCAWDRAILLERGEDCRDARLQGDPRYRRLPLGEEGRCEGRGLSRAEGRDRGADQVRPLVRGRLQVDRLPPIQDEPESARGEQVLRGLQERRAEDKGDRGEAARHPRPLQEMPDGDTGRCSRRPTR